MKTKYYIVKLEIIIEEAESPEDARDKAYDKIINSNYIKNKLEVYTDKKEPCILVW